MSDLKTYITKRKARDKAFALNFEEGYEKFKIGVLLKEARKRGGYTQEELAIKLSTKKEAISRLENHSEDIKISTLFKIAKALDLNLEIRFI